MKRLILASLAVAAMLASCEKVSEVDSSLTSNRLMKFAPYAGANSTRGTAINTNTDFEDTYGSFNVSGLKGDASYFGFGVVNFGADDEWSSANTHYWPNESGAFHFAAYSPIDAAVYSTVPTYANVASKNTLAFGYTVPEAVASQKDIMYAITDVDYDASADVKPVGLHFKHTLTQVAFTATKDTELEVTVNSVKICNVVNNATFAAIANTNDTNATTSDKDKDNAVPTTEEIWKVPAGKAQVDGGGVTTQMSHYAAIVAAPIVIEDENITNNPINISDADDVMMLMPQTLTAWDPDGTYTASAADYGVAYGTDSYIVVNCIIKIGAQTIVENKNVYVPFSTANIVYSGSTKTNGWLPGYKLTYNLHFGGGYSIPTDPANPTDPEPNPEPGEVPDPDIAVPTLRPITYSVSVDAWVPVNGPEVKL